MRSRPGFILSGVFASVVLVALAVSSGACLAPSQQASFGSCAIHEDQKASFLPKVPGFPVGVVIDQKFTQDQAQKIRRAIDEWNQKGQLIAGTDIFVIRPGTVPEHVRSLDTEACERGYESDVLYVIREYVIPSRGEDRWTQLGLDRNTPAVTMRCSSGLELGGQIVLLHTVHANREQLASIALHELGHAVGLNHSCGGKSDPRYVESSSYISCEDVPEPHPYREAVMFPSLGAKSGHSTIPEIKENLRKNDLDRMACLYQ